jgi:uncharacterized membrane protein
MDLTNLKKNIRDLYNVFIANLDSVTAVLLMSAGLLIILLSAFAGIGQYGMGFAFVLGSLVYYLLKTKHPTHIVLKDDKTLERKQNKTLFLANNIIFFVLFLFSVVILWNVVYYRPPTYFFIITIAYLSLFLEIYIGKREDVFNYFIIIKTIILSIPFRMSRYYTFPTIPGNDTHFHLGYAKYILDNGTIYGYDAAGKYLYTPLWHIYEAISGILLDLALKDLLFFTIVLLFTITLSLFSYLIAKQLFNTRVALMALIFANIADMLFVRGVTNINPGSFVHIFLIISLYCLIQQKNKHLYSLLIIIFMFCSILTHQLSTFAFFSLMFSILVGKYIYKFISTPSYWNKNLNMKNNTVLLFFITMIFYWSTMGSAAGSTFFDSMVYRLNRSLSRMFNEYASGDSPETVYANMFSQFDIISNLTFNLGYSILVGLAVIGILLLIHKKNICQTSFSYVFASIMLYIIIYPGTLIGLNQLFIPHRFISQLEIFLIIFASIAMHVLHNSINKKYNTLVISIVAMFLIFFMVTTPFINHNDSLYNSDRVHREGYMYSELKAIEWNNIYSVDKKIITDPLIKSRPLSTVSSLNVSSIQLQEYPRNLDVKTISSNILIRQYAKDRPDMIIGSTFGKIRKTNMRSFIQIVPYECNKIYSSNSGSVYMPKNS